jgi:hypothetical protein
MNNSQNDYHKIKKYEQYTLRGQIRYIAEVEHIALKTHRFLVDSAQWTPNARFKAFKKVVLPELLVPTKSVRVDKVTSTLLIHRKLEMRTFSIKIFMVTR